MGEVVVSSGCEMELETEKSRHGNMKIKSDGGGSAAPAAAEGDSTAVRWERFLPKLSVRVLLVEADDSTRQIISALLRKCSYRVAAVGDGLKAWEVLKGRPHSIDLILTEVELPSISGYALLTLIMEHETCKNIPVIMMSQQDSVSTVYKCMLRGATDFLVKPVRKNELRNLWQHVWRKQASSIGAGLGPPDDSVALEKDETTAENNAISNHSSGYMSSIQKNKEGVEKGNDSQSSCSKTESETEVKDVEHGHDLSQRKIGISDPDSADIPAQEECHQPSKKMCALDNEMRELQAVANVDADLAIAHEDKNSDVIRAVGENVENNHSLEKSSKEAIDLIGAFDNHLKTTLGTSLSNVNTSMLDIFPLLDLSLRRSQPSSSVNLVNDEMPRMNHSDASPFSRYINKPMQLSNQQKDHQNSEKHKAPEYNPDAHDLYSPKLVPIETIQTGKSEFTFSYSQNRDISHPIPVRGVRYENVVNVHGTTHHSESIPQPTPLYPSDHQPQSSQQKHGFGDRRIINSVDQMENKQGNKLEDLEVVSPGNDQSGNSSLCNGSISHHQSSGSGSSKINAIPVIKAPSECGSGNDETFHIHDGAHRSLQREAALTKFRQKRKDRCFDKKVRYESRKKLAEQRPRVKGQFVRQPQPGNLSVG